MDRVLTRAQQKRRRDAPLVALRRLLRMPESRDLLEDVRLGCYYDNFLYLTNQGLVVVSYGGDGRTRKRKVEASLKLGERFGLNVLDLKRLIEDLRAK